MDLPELGAGIPDVLLELLDRMDDLVFFAKDREGRYRIVNQTLVRRVGWAGKDALIGRRVDEVFPAPFGDAFRAQDEAVLGSGRAIRNRLELHFYARRSTGWCRTFKLPWLSDGRQIGLMGFSEDLHRPASDRTPGGVARALDHLERHLHRKVSLAELAGVAGMAVRTFERAVQTLFRASAGDLVIQARIDRACRLLRETGLAVGEIARDCGYAGHSAFSRQFRSRVGVAPTAFRRHAPS